MLVILRGTNKRFMQTEDVLYIHLDKACFQHNMAYGNYKDLGERTESD